MFSSDLSCLSLYGEDTQSETTTEWNPLLKASLAQDSIPNSVASPVNTIVIIPAFAY